MRAGVGLYYDRGEFFSEFSPSAGAGFNGPVRRDPGAAVCGRHRGHHRRHFRQSLRKHLASVCPRSAAAFSALLPNISQTESGKYPAGNLYGPFLFGGYAVNNKVPYTENWTFDVQYQPIQQLAAQRGLRGQPRSA